MATACLLQIYCYAYHHEMGAATWVLQVLAIVYGAPAVSKGLFFPDGVNGKIDTAT
jgi:hypothetical protein